VRIYQTHERQTFHTDSCDVVGLLCLREAKSGGDSLLVSSTTIFNELRRQDPGLAALLFEPIATDRRGEVPQGMKPYFEIPVFNWHEGRLTAIYQRQYIDSAQRFADAPRIDRRLDLCQDEPAGRPRVSGPQDPGRKVRPLFQGHAYRIVRHRRRAWAMRTSTAARCRTARRSGPSRQR
jgi:hypothetical protein